MPTLTTSKFTAPRVKPQRLNATLAYRENLSAKFNYFELETKQPFDFDAGQYVNVIVAANTFRAYSIATRPANNKFGLLVDTRPGGPGSQFFEALQIGNTFEFLGPLGIFVIRPNDGVENILLLGTGSGLSPLRCIVDDEFLVKNTTRNFYLYMGLTKVNEIFWKDYFEDIANKHSNFKYRLAILEPDEAWNGHTGFNTDLMKMDFPDASSCAAYLCGHPAMIKGATEILLASNCAKENIHEEKFFAQ
jgi:NAD(P)H-flavin reductase